MEPRNLFTTKTAFLAYLTAAVSLVIPFAPGVGEWVAANQWLINGIVVPALMLVVRKITKGEVVLFKE